MSIGSFLAFHMMFSGVCFSTSMFSVLVCVCVCVCVFGGGRFLKVVTQKRTQLFLVVFVSQMWREITDWFCAWTCSRFWVQGRVKPGLVQGAAAHLRQWKYLYFPTCRT